MKKTLLITVAAIVVLIALFAWAYLMFIGTPESVNDVFTNFGFGTDTSREVTIVDPIDTPDEVALVDTTGEALRQLTTRPIAGFIAINASGTQHIRYAERGTGHIYSLDLTSGEERRLSGTTIPRVTTATFSETGQFVALQSLENNVRDTFVGEIIETENKVSGTSLPPNTTNLLFVDNEVFYTVANEFGSTVYSYNLITTSLQTRVTVPFTNIILSWNSDVLHLYNQYTRLLEGSLYRITPDLSLEALLPGGFGFLAQVHQNEIVYTTITNNALITTRLNTTTGEEVVLPILAIPEKCSFDSGTSNLLWCASELDTSSLDYIEDWYKGTFSAQDYLWKIDLKVGEVVLISDLSIEASRQIDVRDLQVQDDQLFFANKIDNTLWMYDVATN